MHTREVHPRKEWRSCLGLFGDEVRARLRCLVVDSLHPLNVQRTGVVDLSVSERVNDAAGIVALKKIGIVTGPVWTFGLLFRVQVVQVAEELIEAVVGRQEFVAIAEVVLAELTCGVTERLKRLSDGDVAGLQALRSTRRSHLGQPGAPGGLTGNKRRATSRAAILRVIVGE